MVVAPTSFRPGIPLSIGVNILNSSAPVIVTASLAVNLNSSAPPVIVIASLAVNQSVDTVVIQQIPGAVASGEFHQGMYLIGAIDRQLACADPESFVRQGSIFDKK